MNFQNLKNIKSENNRIPLKDLSDQELNLFNLFHSIENILEIRIRDRKIYLDEESNYIKIKRDNSTYSYSIGKNKISSKIHFSLFGI